MPARNTATVLRLINWGRFQDEQVRLEGSTLFTGINGSGKSMVLDAITYLLTGNTQFNKAAGDRDRDVIGYVRGDTKSNGADRYLRSGEVVSYLAMEFFSETENKSFTIGACIESPDETSRKPYWFILPDTKIEDITFAKREAGKIYIYPKNQMEVKGKKLSLSVFLPREKAIKQVFRAMGLRCDVAKYRNKLVKMLAFNPENNIDKFISDCVLEPGKVDSLAQVREQKEKNDELTAFYQSLLISKKKLDELETVTCSYEAKAKQYASRKMMLAYQGYMQTLEEREEIGRRKEFLTGKLAGLEKESIACAAKVNAAMERLSAAKNNNIYGEVSGSLSEIERLMQLCDRELEGLEAEAARIERLGEELTGLVNITFAEEFTGGELDVSLFGKRNLSGAEGEPSDKLSALFLKLREKFLLLKEECYAAKARTDATIRQTGEEITELEKERKALESNIMLFPKEVRREKDIIEAELRSKGINTQVRFFAELVKEIKDESWRGAIETFLGHKRFYLIVDGKYCEAVMDIIREKKLHAIHAVITDKLPQTEATHGSAAELLDIPNTFARLYANLLLNGIHLCKDIKELHEHPKGGITKDGMLAKSYAVSLMKTADTRFYLGRDAIRLRLEQLKRELELKGKDLEEGKAQLEEIEVKIESIEKTDWHQENYSFDSFYRLANEQEHKRDLKKQREKIENTPGLAAIMQEISFAEEDLEKKNLKKDKVVGEISVCKKSLEEEENKENNIVDRIVEAKEAYEAERQEAAELEAEMIKEYEKLRERKESACVITPKTVKNLENELAKALHNMEDVQIECAKLSETDTSRRGAAFIPFYRQQRNDITNVKIEEASEKLEKHKNTMRSSFMNDFIGELKEKIDEARGEISALNRELKELPFGNDIYRFVMDEKSERQIFFRICKRLDEYGSADMYRGVHAEDEEFDHDVEVFMTEILEEEDETEYTDYRKYFTYDMKILTSQGDQMIEADLSKKQGSASGGEKQTPYFIILAASLMQCYPKNSCCVRLAFIDEAYSALSEERIEQLVKYFEDNRFQVIYAAPPNKIGSIGVHINSTVSLVVSGRYTFMAEGMIKADEFASE